VVQGIGFKLLAAKHYSRFEKIEAQKKSPKICELEIRSNKK